MTHREEVKVEENECPECGGELVADGEEVVSVTEIPEIPKPEVKEFRMEVCRCGNCGKKVRARHPEVAEDQWGATAQNQMRNIECRISNESLPNHFRIPHSIFRILFERMLGIELK